MRRASPRLFSTSPPTARLFLSVTLLRVLLSFATASEIPDWPPLLQQAYLKASNTAASNWFGFSVAISGETAVVGAFKESSDAVGVNGTQTSNTATNSGAAYVFVRMGTNWIQQAYLKASNAKRDDNFGIGIAIEADTIVVGASGEDSAARGSNGNENDNTAIDSGAAYVFKRSGTNWIQQAYLKPSNTATNAHFGARVAISAGTIVVGATGEQSGASGVNGNQSDRTMPGSGAAYVFVQDGTNWVQQAYLKASIPTPYAGFGLSVALSENSLIVGANEANSGAAYIFVRNGTNWSQQAFLKASNAEANDRFGDALTISGDTVVVGARWEDSASQVVNGDQYDNRAPQCGAAYVFVREGTDWTQQAYLKAWKGQANDSFGSSVALNGNTLVVGAYAENGGSNGINGDPEAVGGFDSGAAYLFVRQGTNWRQEAYIKTSAPGVGADFGWSAAISGDTVIIGAFNEGSAATGVNGDQTDNTAGSAGAAYIFSGVLGLPHLSAATRTKYSLTPLDILPGMVESHAERINNRGEIVGYCLPPSSSQTTGRASLWKGSQVIDLGFQGGSSFATDINEPGQIVVNWDNQAVYDGTNMNPIPLMPNGDHFTAIAINDSGALAGTATVNATSKAYLYTQGAFLNISPGPGDVSGVVAINNAGQATGQGFNPDPHPFLYTPGKGSQYLPLLSPFAEGSGHDINEAGDVIGDGYGFIPSRNRGFLYHHNAHLVELMPLSPTDPVYAWGLNNEGQIVGRSDIHAVLWSYDGSLLDLAASLDQSGSGWSLREAKGINDLGQIVGDGQYDPDGNGLIQPITRAFLLTPIPALSVTVVGQNVTLSWSTNSQGFVLTQNLDLNPSTWVAITDSPQQVADRYEVVLNASSSQKQFFRLQRK